MNILCKIIKSAVFCLFLACQAVPMHGFWPQAFCARLSAAIYQIPQKVKNSSIFNRFNWFSVGRAPSQQANVNSNSSWYQRWYLNSIPAIPAGFYHSKKEKNENLKAKPVTSSQCLKKPYVPTSKAAHAKIVALACSVLGELKIRINTSDPIKQIKNLSANQENRAFEYLQDLFVDEDDESDLPTLYTVMQHLKAPRTEYPEFFDIVSNHLEDCRREHLAQAMEKCKNVPPRFKVEMDKANTNKVKALWVRSHLIETPAPKEIYNILRKVHCSTSSWQAPGREKSKVGAFFKNKAGMMRQKNC